VRVVWEGDHPQPPLIQEVSVSAQAGWIQRQIPNPNAPQINERGQVGQAMIMLEGIDLTRSKPWSHSIPTIQLSETGISVLQPSSQRIGFVQTGSEVEITSQATRLTSLRARGASFFTLMFPKESQVLQRKFPSSGVVELSNATGQIGPRAYLHVAAHPYLQATDTEGRTELSQIPEGEYQLKVWLPNWQIERVERDPETGVQVRQRYAAPLEKKQRVSILSGETRPVEVRISTSDFPAPRQVSEKSYSD
jgi:hypothetical protein